MKKKRVKNIRRKISGPVILLILVSLLLVGGISSWLNYKSTFTSLDQTMTQTVAITSARIEHQLKEYANIALETGSVARLSNPDTSAADRKAIIDQKIKTYGFAGGGILDTRGRDIFTREDDSEQEYFQEAMAGVYHVSEPFTHEKSGKLTVAIAAPLWEGGIPQSRVAGVVYFLTQPEFLSNIVDSVHISAGGAAYLIDENGFTIAHKEISRVESGENIFEVAKKTPALEPLADIHREMVAGKSGFDTYQFNGVEKFVAYAPIAGTHGWSVAINAPISDFMKETYSSIITVVVLLVVFVVAGTFIAYGLANSISKPVTEIATAAARLSEGNFNVSISHSSQDELGGLADSMRSLCGTVVGILQGMEHELGAMRNGDFTVEARDAHLYVGDFTDLRVSLDEIRESLHDTLSQINVSAEQVSSGAEQVSSGAQELSQGATEQASSIEELSATINEISNQVMESAENAQSAWEKTNEAGSEVMASNRHMEDMIRAMGEISGKSAEISKIIKTIEDIAFQTNILALNAAVEAARAGAAGKGFAVVADEVRNLAGKSAEAAKNTTQLIEESVRAVENGTQIADQTAKAMHNVVESAQAVTGLIQEIAGATERQSSSIAQVTTGLDQVSSVVQTNSATAEQSAAASEELSGQAQMLKGLVGKFRLKQETGMVREEVPAPEKAAEPVKPVRGGGKY